jgi:GT2 family glycosyltransferase
MFAEVLIPTNRPVSQLVPVLKSYQTQQYRKFNLTIITEGEEDLLKEICNDMQVNNIRIFSIPQGTQSAAVSRNLGIAHAKGDLIIFSDDDMLVDKDFVAEHVRVHQEQSNAIVRGLRYQYRFDGTVYIPRWEREALVHWNNSKRKNAWAYFVKSNASVPTKLLEKVGGFDNNFLRSGCEDTDLAYRLLKEDSLLFGNVRAVNYHLSIDDIHAKFSKRVPNFIYFKKKYPEDTYIHWFVRLTLQALERGQINQLFLQESEDGVIATDS